MEFVHVIKSSLSLTYYCRWNFMPMAVMNITIMKTLEMHKLKLYGYLNKFHGFDGSESDARPLELCLTTTHEEKLAGNN